MDLHHDELKRIFDAVYSLHPMGAVMYDLEEKVVLSNDMARALYNQHVPPGSLLMSAVMAPGRQQPELLQKARLGQPVTLEPYELVPPSAFMHEEADSHWLRENYNPVLHPETRQLMGIVCLIEDCTVEIYRDLALRQALHYIQEMGNATPLLLVVIDQQHEIHSVNHLTEVISGYGLHEARGRNFMQLMVSEDDQMTLGRFLLDIQTGEAPETVECPLLCRDGARLSVRWRFTQVPNIGTELMQVMLIGQYVGQVQHPV